jgi:hypothetical protein
MKKYLCLLTILLNTYGSDCENVRQTRINNARNNLMQQIKDLKEKLEQAKANPPAPSRMICTNEKKTTSGQMACLENRLETPEEAKELLNNQLTKELSDAESTLKEIENNPNLALGLTNQNETYNMWAKMDENETSCADICIISGASQNNILTCPIAHSCSVESGINNTLNCPLAKSCFTGVGIDLKTNCPNAR